MPVCLEASLCKKASQAMAAESLGDQVEADLVHVSEPLSKKLKSSSAASAVRTSTEFFGKARDPSICSAEWKEVFKIASPNYIPASALTIKGSQIPAKASWV
ncbi:hypothetical protein K439DRAFT_1617823 [Ramaria rubella]|nr:hypothetical protein K439DRAFT_1617823 [Ramaria rubella]